MQPRPEVITVRGADRRRHPSTAAWHVHWYRWSGPDAFSGSSLYACRCGVARPGL